MVVRDERVARGRLGAGHGGGQRANLHDGEADEAEISAGAGNIVSIVGTTRRSGARRV